MIERNWIEIAVLGDQSRTQIDTNVISGEPPNDFARHTPPGDRSGDLWMPGFSPYRMRNDQIVASYS